MSEHQLLQALLEYQKVSQQYLLNRNRFNAERLYRKSNELYFRIQDLWGANHFHFSQSPDLNNMYQTMMRTQLQIEKEHG